MNFIEISVLSLALAIDALIVSFSYGVLINKKRLLNAFKLAFSFGFFQFLMPIIGWFLTGYIYSYLKIYSKWIVFIVFMFLGLKFLKESCEHEDNEQTNECISFMCLIMLSIATSIDALGAGISIKFLNTAIYYPAILIGITTFILSFAGFISACIFKSLNKRIINVIGSLLLIYLGVKALF